MAPLSWLTPLIAACTALAWAIVLGARGRPTPLYRPVAWLLSWLLCSDLVRAALQAWVLRPARAELGPAPPYPWPVAAAYHVEQALALSWPVALAAAGAAIFLRRRARGFVIGAWAALSIGFAAAYPWLRLARRDTAHAIVDTAAIAVVVVCAAASLGVRRDRWRAVHLAIGAVVAREIAVAAVMLWWPDPSAHWAIARKVYVAVWALVLAGEAWHLARPK